MLTEAKRIANHDRVVELLNTVARDGISELLKWLEESDFFTAPASHAYHGSYIGGLCEHSIPNIYYPIILQIKKTDVYIQLSGILLREELAQ